MIQNYVMYYVVHKIDKYMHTDVATCIRVHTMSWLIHMVRPVFDTEQVQKIECHMIQVKLKG